MRYGMRGYNETESNERESLADFWMFKVMPALLVVAWILLIVGIPLENYNEAYAAEDALQECRERGYENYLDFERTWLSQEALAVRCEYPTKNYNIDGATGVVPLE